MVPVRNSGTSKAKNRSVREMVSNIANALAPKANMAKNSSNSVLFELGTNSELPHAAPTTAVDKRMSGNDRNPVPPRDRSKR